MTRQISLSVNGVAIPMDYFVQEFADHVTAGMLEALEGTGPLKTVNIAMDGEKVTIDFNGKPLAINPFVTKIMRNTLTGMVSSLKGVTKVEKLNLAISR